MNAATLEEDRRGKDRGRKWGARRRRRVPPLDTLVSDDSGRERGGRGPSRVAESEGRESVAWQCLRKPSTLSAMPSMPYPPSLWQAGRPIRSLPLFDPTHDDASDGGDSGGGGDSGFPSGCGLSPSLPPPTPLPPSHSAFAIGFPSVVTRKVRRVLLLLCRQMGRKIIQEGT